MLERLLPDDAATRALGRALAAGLPPSTAGVLLLSGHLGAGKTTLVKGLAAGLGVAEEREVTSPTFLRMTRYGGRAGPDLVHVDAYRMQGAGDVYDLGLDEDLAGGCVVALEWPENVADALPADHLRLELDHRRDGGRGARLSAGGPESVAWLERVRAQLTTGSAT